MNATTGSWKEALTIYTRPRVIGMIFLVQSQQDGDVLSSNQLQAALEAGAIDEIKFWTNEKRADVKVKKDSEWATKSGETKRTGQRAFGIRRR